MDITCAICLESFTPSCEVSNTPCGHLFHTLCIFKSVTNSQNTCPTCRQPCGQLKNIRRVYLQGEIGKQVSSQQGPHQSAQQGAQTVSQGGQQSAQLSAQTISQQGAHEDAQLVTQLFSQPLRLTNAQGNNAMQASSLAVTRAQQSAQTDPQLGVQPVIQQDAQLPLSTQRNNAMRALGLAVERAQQSAQTDPQPGPSQGVQPITQQDAQQPLYVQRNNAMRALGLAVERAQQRAQTNPQPVSQQGTQQGAQQGAQQGTQQGTQQGAQHWALHSSQHGAQIFVLQGSQEGAQQSTQLATQQGSFQGVFKNLHEHSAENTSQQNTLPPIDLESAQRLPNLNEDQIESVLRELDLQYDQPSRAQPNIQQNAPQISTPVSSICPFTSLILGQPRAAILPSLQQRPGVICSASGQTLNQPAIDSFLAQQTLQPPHIPQPGPGLVMLNMEYYFVGANGVITKKVCNGLIDETTDYGHPERK